MGVDSGRTGNWCIVSGEPCEFGSGGEVILPGPMPPSLVAELMLCRMLMLWLIFAAVAIWALTFNLSTSTLWALLRFFLTNDVINILQRMSTSSRM